MFTHICIETASKTLGETPLIKKGDYATLVLETKTPTILGGHGYEFKEHKGWTYSARLFLPLPPQQEKTVYVAISEEVKKEKVEPILN
jgi:hypothetical protein